MPTTDARGHTVPDPATESPSYAGIFDAFLSVKDPIPVANASARAVKLTELADAGIVPAPDNPVFFFRGDAGAGRELEYTTDGSSFHAVSAGARGPFAMAAGICSGAINGQSVAISDTFPAGRFTVAPLVVPSMVGIAGFTSTLRPAIQTISPSGVTFFVNSTQGASVTGTVVLWWIAVQMTPTVAAG